MRISKDHSCDLMWKFYDIFTVTKEKNDIMLSSKLIRTVTKELSPT